MRVYRATLGPKLSLKNNLNQNTRPGHSLSVTMLAHRHGREHQWIAVAQLCRLLRVVLLCLSDSSDIS